MECTSTWKMNVIADNDDRVGKLSELKVFTNFIVHVQ